MKFPVKPYRLPDDKQQVIDRAKRLAWITIVFMISIIAVVGFTMGSSEAMKAYGYWWADAVAAIIISVEILRDGFSDLKQVWRS